MITDDYQLLLDSHVSLLEEVLDNSTEVRVLEILLGRIEALVIGQTHGTLRDEHRETLMGLSEDYIEAFGAEDEVSQTITRILGAENATDDLKVVGWED